MTGSGAQGIDRDQDANPIDRHDAAVPAYHRPGGATSDRSIADRLVDIENGAARRDRKAKRGGGFGFPAGRVRDLTRFFAFTYGGELPDDDAGRESFFVLAAHVARLNGDPERNVRRYAETWCPWMPEDELDALVRRVLAKPYRWRADKLGAEIGLLDEVRTRLRITTIRPMGVTLDQLNERRRARWNATRRKQTRAGYLAEIRRKVDPWTVAGMSRAKWYRLGKHRETGSASANLLCRVTHTLSHTPAAPPAAPPQGFPRCGMRLGSAFPSPSWAAIGRSDCPSETHISPLTIHRQARCGG